MHVILIWKNPVEMISQDLCVFLISKLNKPCWSSVETSIEV